MKFVKRVLAAVIILQAFTVGATRTEIRADEMQAYGYFTKSPKTIPFRRLFRLFSNKIRKMTYGQEYVLPYQFSVVQKELERILELAEDRALSKGKDASKDPNVCMVRIWKNKAANNELTLAELADELEKASKPNGVPANACELASEHGSDRDH